VFENRLLRRIFGQKKDEVVGCSEKLHTDKFNNVYYKYSRHRIRHQAKEDEMDRTCSTNGDKRDTYMILVGNTEENRPLGRHRRRQM
jgi:hypothetical protein